MAGSNDYSPRVKRMAETLHELPFGNEAIWDYLTEELEALKHDIHEALDAELKVGSRHCIILDNFKV